ncbi:hypothetical protein BD324DRAFT_652461 [Kockovaella imperatae]|uniref:HTH APSES-type domain-containing protein n=1 Tax=Kockovaella imperatae TaxID=4999 RepID=A0A1Y1UCQ9_9TREE|nr:hypothetical protein BD324DRAFT_652461 [Kockovaella imperatae]ORX35327.1 hypothetical protein BD324DRAFT_652461 [Kockovaella imperatae]
MARSPRTLQHASSSSTTPVASSSTPRQSTIIPPPFSQPGSSNTQTPVTRTRSRRSSVATASSSRTPNAVASSSSTAPSTPPLLTPTTELPPKLGRQAIESKPHALRSVLGEKERSPCPFPTQYGGRDKCAVVEDDERDEVLMAVCGACAIMDNRALSADEIASIAIDQAWLRPPSAAVGPPTIVNNAIRAHYKRCTSSDPPRQPLLKKHQLAGSLNESCLESALHPEAFSGGLRPKGTVWYLAPSGKAKWKNPFDGLEVPTPPPRKPVAPKKAKADLPRKIKPAKEIKVEKTKRSGAEEKNVGKVKEKMTAGKTPPVKLRLFLNGSNAVEDDTASDAGSSSQSASKNPSRRPSLVGGVRPIPAKIGSTGKCAIPTPIRIDDSSDEYDSSDSEVMEIDSRPSPRAFAERVSKLSKPRKERPSPLMLLPHAPSPANAWAKTLSSMIEMTPPTMTTPTFAYAPFPPQPVSSPFPTHSLDNTTWTVRRDPDHFAALETSSSSSDDEMREPGEWGLSSSILIQSTSANAEDENTSKPAWTAEDEEANVKEATDALRVLFPMSTPDDREDVRPVVRYNQLDNRPAPSDTSSLAESTSTATATARGPLKSADLAASIALVSWNPTASPALSPNFRSLHLPTNGDSSPSQHLSRLHNSFEPADMDIDEEPWLDECGGLPVKAEDSLSDIEIGSVIGDTPTPEHDRQLNTAAWARDTAASASSYRVKEEPVDDYPSPVTTAETEADDGSATYRTSRASSSDSHTPSSRSSELPHFEYSDQLRYSNMEEVLMGPESISLEELDGWIAPGMGSRVDKTPQKAGRHGKSRHYKKTEGRCSGDWGSIGVGMASSLLALQAARPIPLHRSRSTKSNSRRRQASPPSTTLHAPPRNGAESLPTPPEEEPETGGNNDAIEMDLEDADIYGIGQEELDAARAEAEAKEEEHRKAVRARNEQHKALLEAYRLRVKEEQTSRSGAISPENEGPMTPWTDLNVAWGSSSTESLNLTTPTPSAVPPSFLHSLLPTSPVILGSSAPAAMDPRDLVSPPLVASMPMLDEALPHVEIDTAKTDKKPAKVAAPAPMSDGDSKMSIVELPSTLPADIIPPSGQTLSSTPAKIAAAPVFAPTAASSSSTATLPPPPPPPAKKTPKAKAEPKEPKEAKEVKAKDVKPVPIKAAPITASPTPAPPTGPSTEVTKPAVAPRPASSQPRSITKPLCAGVDACVVDNIPVYSHSYVNKKTGKSFVLLRRLDTDFVNASGLLLAVGVPLNKHSEYLSGPSPWQHAHHLVPPQANGSVYSPGVAGVWIPYSEAKFLAKKLKLDASSSLANILRDDLFALFAKLAALNQEHSPAEAFGLPFGAPIRTQSKASLSANPNSSKSTPNLSTLSSSAPAPSHLRNSGLTASTPLQTPKGSLVRTAPATPPDGCPHPKRRRATIVGEASPMAKGPIAPPLNASTPATTPAPVSRPLPVPQAECSPVAAVIASPTKMDIDPPRIMTASTKPSVPSPIPTPMRKPPPRAARPSTGPTAPVEGKTATAGGK